MGIITTNLKVEIDFTLPGLIATKIVTYNFHVYDFAKGRYDIILGKDILTALGLNLRFSDHVTKSDNGPLQGSMAPMVDLGTYEF